MRKLLEVFSLELKALVRSNAVALLLLASAGWMTVFPLVVRGDGTEEGVRELCVRYSLGGVFVLLLVALLASATGSIARERTARRLQLTLVRPVRFFVIVLGKIAAHVFVGAAVLAVACGILAVKADLGRTCAHVLSPVLPSPREEARAMYAEYMKDPKTPEAVKRTKKEIVLRLLENRAIDHYQVIATNETAAWRFAGLAGAAEEGLSVRMRFTNPYEMRDDVRGAFAAGPFGGMVSNITQAVVKVPLTRRSSGASGAEGTLTFANHGRSALMIRPRKDLNVLVAADGFGWNLCRGFVALVAILSLVVSAGTVLSAGLGRPVALFVAFVTLIVSEMSPSVVSQYPDELETCVTDRIGLQITRFVAEITRPVSASAPLEALSADECIERAAVLRLVLGDLVVVPVVLSLLAAFVLPHKQDDA